MSRDIGFILRLGVSLALLALLVWMMGEVGPLLDQLSELDVRYAVATVVVMFGDRVLMTYKWSLLLRSAGQHLPLWRGVRVYCAAMIWGMFLPLTIGADVVRAYTVTRQGLEGHAVVATIVMERLTGFLTSLLLGVASLAVLVGMPDAQPWMVPMLWAAGGILLTGIVLVACSMHDKAFEVLQDRILARWKEHWIAGAVRRFHGSYRALRTRPRVLVSFILLTLVSGLTPIVQAWLLALGMGIHLPFSAFAAAVPLSHLATRLPVSVDGIGVYEAVFAGLLAMAGATPTQAVAISFAGRITQTIAYLPWWLWQSLAYGDMRPKPAVLNRDAAAPPAVE